MDFSLTNHRDFVHKHVHELPTPSLIISKPVLQNNVQTLLRHVDDLGLSFRPHVKTLKCLEVTRMMLGNGKHRKTVASTVCEIRGMLPLVHEGILDECLFGLPIYPSVVPELQRLSQILKIVLMVDNNAHVDVLERPDFTLKGPNNEGRKWPVFIKVDVGTQRAGLVSTSAALINLVKRVDESDRLSLLGFYCHAGHSYSCKTEDATAELLETEVLELLKAVNQANVGNRHLILSIGATPTAHVIKRLKTSTPPNLELELHAGNFCANDLQQVSTSLVQDSDISVRVLAEVASIYEDRNEVLINAGVIALGRESSSFPGFGHIVERPGWIVSRISQEHGVLRPTEDVPLVDQTTSGRMQLGEKLTMYPQHACIAAASFHVYYVVNADDQVVDTWIPWRGW